jgi:hypothetical protein
VLRDCRDAEVEVESCRKRSVGWWFLEEGATVGDVETDPRFIRTVCTDHLVSGADALRLPWKFEVRLVTVGFKVG